MKNKDAAPECMKSEIAMFWDMNRCPIPEGYDPCRVGPRIDSVLMSLGYSGPLTIVAIGDLEDTPHEVLRALSSSGILVKEVSCGLMSVLWDMLKWKRENPPPATLMLISDYREWLWESFLTDAMDSQETRRPERKCSVDAFTCKSCKCDFTSQSFEMFNDHLMSKEHIVKISILCLAHSLVGLFPHLSNLLSFFFSQLRPLRFILEKRWNQSRTRPLSLALRLTSQGILLLPERQFLQKFLKNPRTWCLSRLSQFILLQTEESFA